MFAFTLFTAACAGFYVSPWEKPQQILFYAAFAAAFWQHRKRPYAGALLIPSLYLLYQALSLGWSPVASGEELGEIIRKGALSLLFFWTAAQVLREEKHRRIFLEVIAIVASVSAALALWHYAPAERLTGLGRSLNPVQGGCLYGFALLCGLVFTRQQRGWWGAVLILLFALLATASRGALLGVLIAAWALFASRCVRKELVLLAVFCCVLLGVFFPELLARADGFRFFLWQEAWEKVGAHWLLGLGYRAPFAVTLPYGQTVFQPHSLWITAYYFGGIVGVAALAGLFYAFWRQAKTAFSRSLLGYALVIGLFDYSLLLVNGEIEWLLFWLPFAMVAAEKNDHENTTHSL